jgi:hypothetical protein
MAASRRRPGELPLLRNRRVEPVQVRQVGHVALNAADVGADGIDGVIEFLPAATGDEDVGTLCHEQLRRGEADTGGAPVMTATFPSSLPIIETPPDVRRWSTASYATGTARAAVMNASSSRAMCSPVGW